MYVRCKRYVDGLISSDIGMGFKDYSAMLAMSQGK